jgi:hypothetical protein
VPARQVVHPETAGGPYTVMAVSGELYS